MKTLEETHRPIPGGIVVGTWDIIPSTKNACIPPAYLTYTGLVLALAAGIIFPLLFIPRLPVSTQKAQNERGCYWYHTGDRVAILIHRLNDGLGQQKTIYIRLDLPCRRALLV